MSTNVCSQMRRLVEKRGKVTRTRDPGLIIHLEREIERHRQGCSICRNVDDNRPDQSVDLKPVDLCWCGKPRLFASYYCEEHRNGKQDGRPT